MLSAVNLFPGIIPYANAADVKEEAKSENSVVRKIKDAGEYVSSLAKREWIEILNFLNKEKDNTSLIEYLYYEWFNKMKSNNKYKDLYLGVMKEYCDKHDKLLKIIELLSYNNV